jgi:diguanylate cyclase (GGDEF)-like protein
LLLCDIDHFKNVNDTYGHPVGDEVLREVARRLLAAVRSYDFVGRYGGEEFLIVLNNCDPASALGRAEQMRAAIANRDVITDRGPIAVTMSVGLLQTADWGDLRAEIHLTEVDAALYAAKTAGRNCVRVALPVKSPQPAELLPDEKVHEVQH